jgi:hypothetical protein
LGDPNIQTPDGGTGEAEKALRNGAVLVYETFTVCLVPIAQFIFKLVSIRNVLFPSSSGRGLREMLLN